MAQMNGMEKRNFTNSARNGGKKWRKCGIIPPKAEWLACPSLSVYSNCTDDLILIRTRELFDKYLQQLYQV